MTIEQQTPKTDNMALQLAVYAIGFGILMSGVWLASLHIEKCKAIANLLVLSWLGIKTDQSLEFSELKEKVTDKSFPASWWTDENGYQLECRAIFSKQWLYVTHTSRFEKPGDYRTFEVAGYSFVVILGKDNQLRAFHNVCRHRAYPVTKKECGRSIVLGCRYHGWSYDTKGKLIKAPEFENVPGFDKSMNGLWAVALEVRQSWIYVNLDAGQPGVLDLGDVESRLGSWDMSDMRCIADWKFEAAFNWKLLGALKTDHEAKEVSFWTHLMQNQEDAQMLHTTLVRRLASGRLLTIKALPKSAKISMVGCSIFSRSPKQPKKVEELKTRIYHDIERLESMQQRISIGLEPLSTLAPSMTKQYEIAALLDAHKEAEELAGSQIHPAARMQSFASEGKADDDCKLPAKRARIVTEVE